jgi:acyl-coenzyme A synthetase/AMP-(fatty) acid ligase
MPHVWPVPRGYRAVPPRYNAAHDVVGRPAAGGRGGDVAVRDMRGVLTFQQLWDAVGRCAGGLARLGIDRGTTYLIRGANCREIYIAFLAGLRLGAVPLLANSLLGIRELGHVVDNGEPALAIVHADAAEAVRELQRSRGGFTAVVTIGFSEAGELPFEALLEGGESAPTADTARDDQAYICYTSGTTGLPKGIVHAHRWIPAHGDFAALHMPLTAADVVMHTSEVSFGWGLGHGFLWPLRNGGSIASFGGRATAERVLAAIERYGVTVLVTVPTLVRAILAMPDAERRDRVGSLRLAYAAGEPLAEPTYRAWVQRFGCELYDAYGASEFQVIVANGPGLPVKPGSMGRPNPGMTIRVLDECLNEVPAGTIGSLAVRADDLGLFLEYRKQPDKWREAHRGGWYDTGDQVFADEDGYFWYVGRQDDLFKSRGYLISPKEVEDAIVGCPGVLEAAVVGRPDPDIGHRIVAFVVMQSGAKVSGALADELRGAVRSLIAPYKVPHAIEFVDSLPKSAVGKLLRRALREEAPVR